MGSARPDLLTSAHVQQTLIHLVHFVRREVHVLAVLENLVERLFLYEKSKPC